ncbi:MAG: hypothetical protein HC923_13695, partial [Myxococcales bacterium]|nr:hypothetical protein [Myxococcales bacterium]
PKLVERAGTSRRGAITAIYTVLVEGEDLDEPIADETKGILDGHIVLRRDIAQRGRFPAIDPLRSVSRCMSAVVDPAHEEAARVVRRLLAVHEDNRDLVQLGAHVKGADPEVDRAIAAFRPIEAFLQQGRDDGPSRFEDTIAALSSLARTHGAIG